jgi:hypothetical protein
MANQVQTAIVNRSNAKPSLAPYPDQPHEKYFTAQEISPGR